MDIKLMLMIFTVYFLFSISYTLAADINQSICENGNGTWVVPIIDPKEPVEHQPKPFCKCSQGFTWQENNCVNVPDKTLCENSDGRWINDNCICSENSIGWVEGVGCEYLAKIENKNSMQGNNLIIVFILGIVILFIYLMKRLFFKKSKRLKFLMLILLTFTLTFLIGNNFVLGVTKEKVNYIPEYLTDSNLLNNIGKGLGILSSESSELIPVIVELKYQPLHDVSKEIRNKYEPEIETYAQQIEKIESNIKRLNENEVRSTDIKTAIENELFSLTSEEIQQLTQIKQNIDVKNQEIRIEIFKLQSELTKESQKSVLSTIENCNGIVTGNSVLVNSVFARIPESCLQDLKNNDNVLAVYKDELMKPDLDKSVCSMGASSWYGGGYTGGIWDAGVIDTGIDGTHPALTVDYAAVFHNTSKYYSDYDDNSTNPDDLDGHGTHVAGIIASTDSTYKGMAYGLDALINAKTCYKSTDGYAYCPSSDNMKAIDWAVVTAGADVVSRSISMCSYTVSDCAMARYLDAVVDGLGISVANSAGNSGPNTGTVGGIAYNVISVAATDDKNTCSISDDSIASLSSRGPTVDGRVKPDIAVSGVNIKSAAYDWEGGFLGLNPDFVDMSGTSMAAPHVAGSVLLVLDYKGVRWNPIGVKALLLNTANNDGSYSNRNDFGWGLIDSSHAYFHRDDVFLGNVTEGSYKFYKGTNLISGDKATLVWNRHVSYNGANYPTIYYTLNDLDLYLYDESTGNLINYSFSGVNNVEQVETQNNYSSVVIKVDAWTTNFYHGSDLEDFALATEENFVSATTPSFNIILKNATPTDFGSNFTLITNITNNGNIKVHNVNITLNLPSGVSLVSGDNVSGIYSINGSSNKNLQWIMNPSNVNNYNFSISVTSNSYGEVFTNSSWKIISVTDFTPPNIIFISPSDSDNSFVNRTYTPITVNVNDASNIDSCILEWNRTNTTMTKLGSGNSVTCFINKTDTDGTYNYKIYANDSFGNSGNSSQMNITFDITNPVITILSPQNTSYTPSFFVNVTLNEIGSWCGYYLDGIGPTTMYAMYGSNMWYKKISELSAGNHNIRFYCNDTVGNMNSTDFVYFSVDITPPTINSVSFNQTLVLPSSSIRVAVNTYDESGISSVTVNGINLTFNGTLWLGNFTASSYDRKHYATIVVTDSVGNSITNSSYSYIVDAYPPTIVINSPVNSSLIQITSTVLNILTDEYATCQYKLNSNLYQNFLNSSYNSTVGLTGIERDGISIGTVSGGASLTTGGDDYSNPFPASGIIGNLYYSNLNDSTFSWFGNNYNYHEQVDISGVRMRHDFYTSNINGTEKMEIQSGDVIYEYVFEDTLNLSSATGKGSISNPEYTYPVNIKLMGETFSIIGVGSNQIKVLYNGAEKIYDTTADTTSTGNASDRFPGTTDWGIRVASGDFGINGLISTTDKIQVVYQPLITEYLLSGQKLTATNKFFELGFEGFATNNFVTVTVEPITSVSAYNSTGNVVGSNLNGFKIFSDVAGSIVGLAGNGYNSGYVLFGPTVGGTTLYPAYIGFWDNANTRIRTADTVTNNTAGTNIVASNEFVWYNLRGNETFRYDFKLSYAGAGEKNDYYLNVTVSPTSPSTITNMRAGDPNNFNIKMAFQNKTGWTSTVAPQFRLGGTVTSAETTEVNATTEGTSVQIGKSIQDVVDDSGLQILTPNTYGASDKVKIKVPSRELTVKVYFGKKETSMSFDTSLTNLEDGTHTIIVNCSDNATNKNNKTIQFTVDANPPTISNSAITPSIVKPNSNVTITTTITDAGSGVNYAYIIGYSSSWNLVYQPQNLTRLGNNWFLTFNIINVSSGLYYFNITAIDNLDKNRTMWLGNVTVNQTSGATNTFTNTSVSTVNNQTTINASETANVTLEITTNQSVSNAFVTIASYTENPGTANVGIPALNKYLELTASSDLNSSLSWVIIKVYYNDSDIPSGYSESNLRIYYQNLDGTWIAYDGTLVGGVNTTANYVWANTTHFSIYGIYIKPTCNDGIQNQGETGVDCGGPCSACSTGGTTGGTGGGGGGGGGGPEIKPCLLNGICDSWETPETCPSDCKKVSTTTNVTETTVPIPPKPTEENKTTPTPTPTAGVPTGFAVLIPYATNPTMVLLLVIVVVAIVMYQKKLFIFSKKKT